MPVVFNFYFLLHVGCRHVRQVERRRWRIGGIFSDVKNTDSLCLGLSYFGNSLRSIKRGSGQVFSNERMVFGVCSIRVFLQFSLDPYYEPLLWSMIIHTVSYDVHGYMHTKA